MVVNALTTAGELVTRNRLRKSLLLQNNDSTNNVFVKRERPGITTVTASNYDFRVPPGGSVALNSFLDGKESVEDRYTVIASVATVQMGVFETEENQR